MSLLRRAYFLYIAGFSEVAMVIRVTNWLTIILYSKL